MSSRLPLELHMSNCPSVGPLAAQDYNLESPFLTPHNCCQFYESIINSKILYYLPVQLGRDRAGLYVIWKALQYMICQHFSTRTRVKHHPLFLLIHNIAEGWTFWNTRQDLFDLISTQQGFLFPYSNHTYSLHGGSKRVISINFTSSQFLMSFIYLLY